MVQRQTLFQDDKDYYGGQYSREQLLSQKEIFQFIQIGIHPHGILTYGLMMNLNTKGTIFENLVGLGSRAALMVPFAGLLVQLWGIQGVNKQSLRKILKSGQNVALVPGGFEEATLTTKTEDRVYLKNRKGFIKYALQYGYTLVPVYTFGENQMFYTLDKFINFRMFLNKFKLVSTVFWSKFGVLPDANVSLITVIGQPIPCPMIQNPSSDDVDKFHKLYTEGLVKVYEKYQPIHAPKMKLRIF